MTEHLSIKSAIDALGGVTKAADEIEGVNQYQTVQQWIRQGVVPAAFCRQLNNLTGVELKVLRPHDWHLIWPEFVEAA